MCLMILDMVRESVEMLVSQSATSTVWRWIVQVTNDKARVWVIYPNFWDQKTS